MKIIVCIKQVPDTETRIRIAPAGHAIVEAGVTFVVSPFDEFAIEEALRLREANGGEVVLVSLGPDRAQAALRSGLALGADAAIHLNDPLFDATDTLGTARALAAAVNGLRPFDVVLTGHQGAGGDNGQIPGLLAELLDVPQVTLAIKVKIADGKATVEREAEGQLETWESSLPVLIAAQKGLNVPRFAKLTGIMAAKKKTIEVKDAAALGLDAAALLPKTRLVSLEPPPSRAAVRMIEGEPDAQVADLLRRLHEEAKVI